MTLAKRTTASHSKLAAAATCWVQHSGCPQHLGSGNEGRWPIVPILSPWDRVLRVSSWLQLSADNSAPWCGKCWLWRCSCQKMAAPKLTPSVSMLSSAYVCGLFVVGDQYFGRTQMTTCLLHFSWSPPRWFPSSPAFHAAAPSSKTRSAQVEFTLLTNPKKQKQMRKDFPTRPYSQNQSWEISAAGQENYPSSHLPASQAKQMHRSSG